MHEVLNRNVYLVKEHVGMFKAANNYDIYAPETGDMIMHCREDSLGLFTRLFRFSDYKRMTPFDIQIRTLDGRQVVRATRGISLFLSKVDVLDENDVRIGGFKQKLLSVGGAFNVLGPNDEMLCALRGKWTGWEFRFMAGELEIARVTKKWAGIGREMLTTADNYVLTIADNVSRDNPLRPLILAAVMCIDMVLKE